MPARMEVNAAERAKARQLVDALDDFVAPRGSVRSYVRALQNARVFMTRTQAEGEKCENETVQAVSDILGAR